MAESIITWTIYKTRQDSRTRIVVCATHHVKWKRKEKYEMYHVIVLLWFPEIIFFSLCVSNVLFYVNW